MPNPFHALPIPTIIVIPTSSEVSAGVDWPSERTSESMPVSTSQASHASTLSIPSEMF